MIKKLIPLFTIVAISFVPYIGYAREIFHEEFKDEDSLNRISANTTGGNISVFKGEEAYLEIVDTDSDINSGVILVKKVSSRENFIAFEVKFKCPDKIPVTEFSVNSDSGKCFYAKIHSNGMINVSDGNKEITTIETAIAKDKWYTLRIVADKVRKKGELKLCANELKSYKGKYNKEGKLKQLDGEYTICDLDFSDSSKSGDFDAVNISTGAETGSIHIAYVKIEDGNNLSMKEPPAPTPVVKDPVPHPVKGQINILYNDEYMYFAVKPIIVNGRVMLPVRNIFEMLDMQVEWNGESSTATAKKEGIEISLTLGSKQAIVNGSLSETDVAPLLRNDRIFMPVRFIGESAGLDVSWNGETETVIMKEREK